jgi:HD-GYP domain-containing protein (c-di-GMP phosphodiesterase class II)
VADAFDAMTSDRVYRAALPVDVAFAELEKGRGTQFDPQIVDVFRSAYENRSVDGAMQNGSMQISTESQPGEHESPQLPLSRRLIPHLAVRRPQAS